MTRLYVANMTKQHHLFMYRLPERSSAITQEIPMGEQVCIGNKDLNEESIAMVLKTQERYGLTDVRRLPHNRKFVGLCYSIGSPIAMDKFLERFEQNDQVLQEEGQERLQRSAEAISERLRAVDVTPLTRAEVEIVEEPQDGSLPRVAVGVEVVPEGQEPRRHGKEGQARRRR